MRERAAKVAEDNYIPTYTDPEEDGARFQVGKSIAAAIRAIPEGEGGVDAK